MRLLSKDGNRVVNIGGSDIWFSLYSTAFTAFGRKTKTIENALKFMETGKCLAEEGYEIGRQFNLIRDELSKLPPEKAVYDLRDKKKHAPWEGKLSPVITSCGNLYTTSDGDDLIFEVVKLMMYAKIKKVDVITE